MLDADRLAPKSERGPPHPGPRDHATLHLFGLGVVPSASRWYMPPAAITACTPHG